MAGAISTKHDVRLASCTLGIWVRRCNSAQGHSTAAAPRAWQVLRKGHSLRKGKEYPHTEKGEAALSGDAQNRPESVVDSPLHEIGTGRGWLRQYRPALGYRLAAHVSRPFRQFRLARLLRDEAVMLSPHKFYSL